MQKYIFCVYFQHIIYIYNVIHRCIYKCCCKVEELQLFSVVNVITIIIHFTFQASRLLLIDFKLSFIVNLCENELVIWPLKI